MTTSTLELGLVLVSVPVCMLVGLVVHELCHLVVIRFLGGDAALSRDGFSVYVDFSLPLEQGGLGVVVAGIAPLLVGLGILVLVVSLGVGLWPPRSVWVFPPLAGWLVLVFPSTDDRVTVARAVSRVT